MEMQRLNALFEGKDYFIATNSEVCVNDFLVCEIFVSNLCQVQRVSKKALQHGARALTHHRLTRPISA